ncbi:hypothetical protein GW17_00031926, partial [Ensete ventricosum]
MNSVCWYGSVMVPPGRGVIRVLVPCWIGMYCLFDFVEAEKIGILIEVKQAILGPHGSDMQSAGISFLESLVSESNILLYIDDGEMHIKNLTQILSAVIEWVEPPNIISGALRSGRSERSLSEGISSASNLFSTIVESHLKGFSISMCTARMGGTYRFEKVSLCGPPSTWWYHHFELVLSDMGSIPAGNGQNPTVTKVYQSVCPNFGYYRGVPEAILDGFSGVTEESQHPVIVLSWY